MAKLKIYTFPDTVLKQKAKPIDRVEKEYFKLADDMLETMYDAPGIGLAANQVGILKRIIVVDTDYEPEDPQDFEEAGFKDEALETSKNAGKDVAGSDVIIRKKDPIILINPRIIYKEGEILYCEGCLSVPDFSHEVKRAQKIKVEYQDINGLTKTIDAEGLKAVCIQHELDHLDGKLFIERISPLKREMVEKKLIKERQKNKDV